MALKALLGLNQAQLEIWAKDQGLPAFRGRQLHDWLYAKGARHWHDITVLPAALRQQEPLPLGRSNELERHLAQDGTLKLLLATDDGLSLETVGIPTRDRLTVCVSSQVGCPMACRFCATGKEGCSARLSPTKLLIKCSPSGR